LFNPDSGLIVVAPIYDGITPSRDDNGVIFTRIGKKFGLAHIQGYPLIQAIYENVYYYPNRNYLFTKNKVAYQINEKLKVVDSILGFRNVKDIYYQKRKEYYFAVITNDGLSFIDKEGKLLTYNKGWTDVSEETSGDNMIIATKNGFGLYNLVSKKIIEPCKYRIFQRKAFFNEQILFAEKNQWKLFDSSGKLLLAMKADSVIPALDEWSGFFFQRKGKWGVMDIKGKILQQPIWTSVWNPRLEFFDGTFADQEVKNYYYEYKEVAGRKIISEVREGVMMALPEN
jgi:hypothetical protein